MRGDWRDLLAVGYADLMDAFKVAKGSQEEKKFMLLLICDEARTLCNVVCYLYSLELLFWEVHVLHYDEKPGPADSVVRFLLIQ